MKADFKFEIDQKVKTVLGDSGLIDMCAIDNTKCICYYVKMKGGQGQWLKEDQIKVSK